LRGGNWNNHADSCAVANRNNNHPDNDNNNIGFRLVFLLAHRDKSDDATEQTIVLPCFWPDENAEISAKAAV